MPEQADPKGPLPGGDQHQIRGNVASGALILTKFGNSDERLTCERYA